MRPRFWPTRGAGVVALLLCLTAPGGAAQLRFRYVPVDAYGNVSLQPAGPSGTAGEYRTWLGIVRQPCSSPPRPTHLVTFRHPCTNRTLTIPVHFPEGIPRLEFRPSRIIYNYGSYTVESHFLPDGSVELIYDSGLLRAP
ncbi:MAG: hypothetical protein L0Z62_41345 [Gemmataceae bacterium]|nr:hypothetical protein [Gemmataceae bacterium]